MRSQTAARKQSTRWLLRAQAQQRAVAGPECAHKRLRCSERGRGAEALAKGVGLREGCRQCFLRDLPKAANSAIIRKRVAEHYHLRRLGVRCMRNHQRPQRDGSGPAACCAPAPARARAGSCASRNPAPPLHRAACAQLRLLGGLQRLCPGLAALVWAQRPGHHHDTAGLLGEWLYATQPSTTLPTSLGLPFPLAHITRWQLL